MFSLTTTIQLHITGSAIRRKGEIKLSSIACGMVVYVISHQKSCFLKIPDKFKHILKLYMFILPPTFNVFDFTIYILPCVNKFHSYSYFNFCLLTFNKSLQGHTIVVVLLGPLSSEKEQSWRIHITRDLLSGYQNPDSVVLAKEKTLINGTE